MRNVLGAPAPARAGLGLAIFARGLVPEDLVELSDAVGLPDVGGIDLVLLTKQRNAGDAVEALPPSIVRGERGQMGSFEDPQDDLTAGPPKTYAAGLPAVAHAMQYSLE
ncbi:hypothetical protein AB0H36_45090, partial [Kribbella sp. NPDC050820]